MFSLYKDRFTIHSFSSQEWVGALSGFGLLGFEGAAGRGPGVVATVAARCSRLADVVEEGVEIDAAGRRTVLTRIAEAGRVKVGEIYGKNWYD